MKQQYLLALLLFFYIFLSQKIFAQSFFEVYDKNYTDRTSHDVYKNGKNVNEYLYGYPNKKPLYFFKVKNEDIDKEPVVLDRKKVLLYKNEEKEIKKFSFDNPSEGRKTNFELFPKYTKALKKRKEVDFYYYQSHGLVYNDNLFVIFERKNDQEAQTITVTNILYIISLKKDIKENIANIKKNIQEGFDKMIPDPDDWFDYIVRETDPSRLQDRQPKCDFFVNIYRNMQNAQKKYNIDYFDKSSGIIVNKMLNLMCEGLLDIKNAHPKYASFIKNRIDSTLYLFNVGNEKGFKVLKALGMDFNRKYKRYAHSADEYSAMSFINETIRRENWKNNEWRLYGKDLEILELILNETTLETTLQPVFKEQNIYEWIMTINRFENVVERTSCKRFGFSGLFAENQEETRKKILDVLGKPKHLRETFNKYMKKRLEYEASDEFIQMVDAAVLKRKKDYDDFSARTSSRGSSSKKENNIGKSVPISFKCEGNYKTGVSVQYRIMINGKQHGDIHSTSSVTKATRYSTKAPLGAVIEIKCFNSNEKWRSVGIVSENQVFFVDSCARQ